jgi:glycosyltransferase involved in cell wall biosynthesis
MNISVGISSYNQLGYLIEAVESALAQTRRPAEIIVVDDASTDSSRQAIGGYASRFPDLIRPILLEQNVGITAVRNRILDEAAGDYLTYLDGDDTWMPTKLEKESELLAEGRFADAAFTNVHYTSADGVYLRAWASDRPPPQGNILPQVIARAFPRRNLFRCELVPCAIWREAGYHDGRLPLYIEWDMRIRLSTRLRWAYVDEPLQTYRLHGTGMASQSTADHLISLDMIEAKHRNLIDGLNERDRGAVRAGLDTWRALLLRRAAREIAQQRQPGFRAEAMRVYIQSLRLHPYLDARLLRQLLT